MNFVQLIVMIFLANFCEFSSFKKGIYGSMVTMKQKLAINMLKNNKKGLVIKKPQDFKDLYNQDIDALLKINKKFKTFMPESFQNQLEKKGASVILPKPRMGVLMKELKSFNEFIYNDEMIDERAFKSYEPYDPVQAYYDELYTFCQKICPSYLTKFEIFRNSFQLTQYFCYRMTIKIRRNEFFAFYMKVAIDYFGWTLTMAVEKHLKDIEDVLNKVSLGFNIFDYKEHKNFKIQFLGFIASLHKVINSTYITFIRIQYRKLKTFDKIAQYIQLKIPEYHNSVRNIFFVLYNIDFHNSEHINSADYLSLLESNFEVDKTTFQGSVFKIPKLFVIDKFLVVKKHTECTFHQTFVYNRYLMDCAQILRKKNFNNILIGTCKLYYKKFFSQLKKYPQFCYFIKGNWKWWMEIMDSLHLELTYVATRNEEINVTLISQRVLLEKMEKFQHIKKQIQKITGLSYINKKLFTYFSYFQQMLNQPDFEEFIASSYRKFMINIEKFNPYDDQMVQIIEKDEQKFIEALNFRGKQIDYIKNTVVDQLIYNCMILSPLEFVSICRKIFYGINLDFFLQFKSLYFMYIFLNKYITNEFIKYNFYQNDNTQMIAYFRKKLQSFLINLEKSLFRVLKYFDQDLVQELGQQKIFATYMMQVNLSLSQDNINFAQKAFELQDIFRDKNHYNKFKNFDMKSQEFNSLLSQIARDYYQDKDAHSYYPDQYVIFFVFIQLSSALTKEEIDEFRDNKEFLFLHFNQWNQELKNVFNDNKQLVSKQPYQICKKNHPVLDCAKNSLTLSIYTNKCPENSVRLNASNCVQKCPENFKQQGIFCIKPEIYVRKIYDNQKDCGKECIVYDRQYWIRPCANSYEELLLFCVPECPMGSEDYGMTCKRKFIEKIKVYFQLILNLKFNQNF